MHCFLCLAAERWELYFWQSGLHHYWNRWNSAYLSFPGPGGSYLSCRQTLHCWAAELFTELGIILQVGKLRHLIWPDILNPHHQAITTQFHCFPGNLPQAQLFYITSHYQKARKRNSATDLWSPLFEDILSCARLLSMALQVMTV